jgi:hypothetical protein
MRAGAESVQTSHAALDLVVGVEDSRLHVHLGNVVGECQLCPAAERPRLVEQFAANCVAAVREQARPLTAAEASAALRPCVRPRVDQQFRDRECADETPASEGRFRFSDVDHLEARLVIDGAHSIREVGGDELRRWSLPQDRALELAARNLLEELGGDDPGARFRRLPRRGVTEAGGAVPATGRGGSAPVLRRPQ